MYSSQVLEHFKNPRNSGEFADADIEVEVTNPVCGDIMRLAAKIEDGRIVEARFQARGCVTSIACGSVLAEKLQGGVAPGQLVITAEQISKELGGLPSATFHGAQLACDALGELLSKLQARKGRSA
jgi:nitrogen fixation NifU-like protein